MIKIVAEMTVKPECLDAFLEAAKELVAQSAAEAGNISYTLNQSLADPHTLAFIETWRDQAAVDIHGATPHFTTILPKLREFCVSGEPIKLFREVSF